VARGYNASKGGVDLDGGMFNDTLTDKGPKGTFAPKWAFREDNATPPSTF